MLKSFHEFVEGKKGKGKSKKDAPPNGGAPNVTPNAKGKGVAPKGLGDEGSQPPYIPDTGKPATKKGKKVAQPQVKETAELMRDITRQSKGDIGQIREAAESTSRILYGNPAANSALVHECRRAGSFRGLVTEMFNHQDFYRIVAETMGSENGEYFCSSLSRAIEEMVGPGLPAPEENPMMSKLGKKNRLGDPSLGGDDSDMDDDTDDDSDDLDGDDDADLGDDSLDLGDDDEDSDDMDDDDSDNEDSGDVPPKAPSMVTRFMKKESTKRNPVAEANIAKALSRLPRK